jgi:hypothetical protein
MGYLMEALQASIMVAAQVVQLHQPLRRSSSSVGFDPDSTWKRRGDGPRFVHESHLPPRLDPLA